MKLNTHQETLLRQISEGSLPDGFKRADLNLLMGTGLVRKKLFSNTYTVTSRGEKRLEKNRVMFQK